jgi:muramidase (phage lysozyme)
VFNKSFFTTKHSKDASQPPPAIKATLQLLVAASKSTAATQKQLLSLVAMRQQLLSTAATRQQLLN